MIFKKDVDDWVKVKDLISKLQELNPDGEAYISIFNKDRTMVADDIKFGKIHKCGGTGGNGETLRIYLDMNDIKIMES